MDTSVSSLHGKHVLLVEDEYYLAEEMAEIFVASGAMVVGPVPDVDRALDLIQGDGPIDAAVLDVNLQGELVYPVADALRALGVPFVFATGYHRSAIPDAFGDVAICEKPVEPDDVRIALFGR